jgi:hypothetical protein
MVESRSVMASLGLDLRSICLIVIVVGAVTGGNLWLHRDDLPLGYVRYSNFGFSFVQVHPISEEECRPKNTGRASGRT